MQVTRDSQVNPTSAHDDSNRAEATVGGTSPPSEAPAGMSLPNQALVALLQQRAFFELCSLDTVAKLASTCTLTQESAVAAHLIFRTLTLRRLLTALNSEGRGRPGSSGHYNRRYEATHRRDEAETRQQQKMRGIVAGKRSKKGGTWEERRQPERSSPSSTSSSTGAIPAARNSIGHAANSPADYTTAMCIQCEVEPGTDWPLGLLCERCYSQLSEAVPQAQGAP